MKEFILVLLMLISVKCAGQSDLSQRTPLFYLSEGAVMYAERDSMELELVISFSYNGQRREFHGIYLMFSDGGMMSLAVDYSSTAKNGNAVLANVKATDEAFVKAMSNRVLSSVIVDDGYSGSKTFLVSETDRGRLVEEMRKLKLGVSL